MRPAGVWVLASALRELPCGEAGRVQLQAAGLSRAGAETGAVTLIQRFGSALNLNIHFHMLFLDGVYFTGTEPPVFRRVAPPSTAELQAVVHRIAERVGWALERRGVLVRDDENSDLALDPADGATMNDMLGHSITYRVAVGPRTGEKVFTLQTVTPQLAGEDEKRVAQASGFSLHAGVETEAGERSKRERLCRYIARPAVSSERLALTGQGNIRYALQTPYRDGTTHVVFEPLDVLARLAALVPLPRVHLTRYHGVLAPHSRLRPRITPAGRGSGARSTAAERPVAKHVALRWMQRLKRVFAIDLETCRRCGGRLEVIASIEAPAVIERLLAHLDRSDSAAEAGFAPRAPP